MLLPYGIWFVLLPDKSRVKTRGCIGRKTSGALVIFMSNFYKKRENFFSTLANLIDQTVTRNYQGSPGCP